jgi:hypothetical protein
MGLTLYFVGAGLTKSLELTRRVPLMVDFVPVLADYLDSNDVLNTLVQMEIGRVYKTACDDCLSLAEQIGRDVPAADRATRDRFAALVRSRSPESIEALFQQVESMEPNTVAAAYAHGLPALFRYAINDVFSTIGWDLNLDPLICFLRRKFTEDAASSDPSAFVHSMTGSLSFLRAGRRSNPVWSFGNWLPSLDTFRTLAA